MRDSAVLPWLTCSFGIFGVMFLVGWNDASQGPLLPLLQSYYNVSVRTRAESCKTVMADV